MKQSAISILFDDRTIQSQRGIISTWARDNDTIIDEEFTLDLRKRGVRHVTMKRAIEKATKTGATLVHVGFPARAWRLMMKWLQLGNPPSVVVTDTNTRPRKKWTHSPHIALPI